MHPTDMAFQVDKTRCIGAACGACWTPANIWFQQGYDGKAECNHQPHPSEVPLVRQIANACQASPSAITETLESSGGTGDTGSFGQSLE